MNIVLSQPCGKIFVGDPHQQIYTFRGAVNALFTVPHTHVFYLTQVGALWPTGTTIPASCPGFPGSAMGRAGRQVRLAVRSSKSKRRVSVVLGVCRVRPAATIVTGLFHRDDDARPAGSPSP